MKKNRKGFTLIELLAVLVVLAILALITTPIVLNVIKQAREGANARSGDAYIRSLDYAVTQCMSKHPNEEVSGMTLVNGTKISVEGDNNCSTVETKGKIPEELKTSSQSLSLNNENKITVGDDTTILTIGNYSFRIKNGNAEPVENNTSSKTYELGEVVPYKGIDFRVIKDNGSSVTLLKDEPLTSQQTRNYGSTSTYETSAGYGGAYFKEDYSTNNYDNSDVKNVVEKWAKAELNSSDLVEDSNGYKVRLINLDELISEFGYEYQCPDTYCNYVPTSVIPTWVYNSGYWYWTMTPTEDSSSDVWSVYFNGSLDNYYVRNDYGVVRPVITVLKSKLQ